MSKVIVHTMRPSTLRVSMRCRFDNVTMSIYFVNVHNTLLHKPVSLNEAHIFLNIYLCTSIIFDVQNTLFQI